MHKRVWPVTSPEHDDRVGAALRQCVDSAESGSLHWWTFKDEGVIRCQGQMVVNGRVISADQDTLLAMLQSLTGTVETKMCMKCGQNRSLAEFARNRNQKDGYATRCKICEAERMRQFTASKRTLGAPARRRRGRGTVRNEATEPIDQKTLPNPSPSN